MEKKKILHVLFSSTYSGAENVACTIIKNLGNDFDMLYCCPSGPIEKILKERNIKYITMKKLNYFELKKIVELYNPDIIDAHDYRATLFASMFSKKCSVISHVHVNNPLMDKKSIYSFLFNYIFKRVKKIIWVSESAYDNYYYKNNVINKSKVIYNIIDSNFINEKSNDYINEKNHDLIFLGRLSTQKNPERLIEIIELLKKKKSNISVAIVGDGVKKIILENLIKEKGLEDNITMYGFKNNPYPILKSSKILIMTSDWEGTPMVALEAQALGKPIVSTPVDGMKKVISQGVNGFLSNDNNEIVDDVLYILDKNNYKKIQKGVIDMFKKSNDSEKYFENIKNIYNASL